MTESENRQGRERTLESLVQLVAALDRRPPGPAGEQMTIDVAELRGEARHRIDDLNRAAHDAVDAEARSDEAMTDDGAPVAAETRD